MIRSHIDILLYIPQQYSTQDNNRHGRGIKRKGRLLASHTAACIAAI